MRENTERLPGMTGKLGMVLLMLTVTILFGAMSLAFFATPSSGSVEIPFLFFFNTILLAVSSVLLHLSFSESRFRGNRLMAQVGIVLGGVFLIGQGLAYWQLADDGMWIDVANRKMQYLYVLSGLHAAHLIGGLAFLSVVHFRKAPSTQKMKELALFFWHFLGILWVYLLFVMLLGG